MTLQVGVKALLRNNAGKYLVIKRKEAFSDGAVWDIPGGRINPDEPLMLALTRELKEEIGVGATDTARLLAAQDIFVAAKDLHVIRLTYCIAFDGEVRLGDEHTEADWLSLDELKKLHLDQYLAEVVSTL